MLTHSHLQGCLQMGVNFLIFTYFGQSMIIMKIELEFASHACYSNHTFPTVSMEVDNGG